MRSDSVTMDACLTELPQSDPVDWVDEHGDFLFNYAFGQLRDRSDAQDVVQETFLAALKACDRFNGHASERTWLVSILRHKICDHFRHKCRERSLRDNSSRVEHQSDPLDESMLWVHATAAECLLPSRRLDLGDFRQSLEIALHMLPPRIAQAFALYEMDECASAEVCHRMDISQANLWTMVHRARKQLRTLMPSWRNEIEDSSDRC